MSRSGYSDDCDGSALQLWRGAVNKAMTGKRGQRLLVDIASAMDAMAEKRLIAEDLISADGQTIRDARSASACAKPFESA